jgi:hypothetical protein
MVFRLLSKKNVLAALKKSVRLCSIVLKKTTDKNNTNATTVAPKLICLLFYKRVM